MYTYRSDYLDDTENHKSASSKLAEGFVKQRTGSVTCCWGLCPKKSAKSVPKKRKHQLKTKREMETKTIWQKILHIAITILTAIATTLGTTSCMGLWCLHRPRHKKSGCASSTPTSVYLTYRIFSRSIAYIVRSCPNIRSPLRNSLSRQWYRLFFRAHAIF